MQKIKNMILQLDRHYIIGLPYEWEWYYDEKNDISTLEDSDGTVIAKMIGNRLTIAGKTAIASFLVDRRVTARQVEKFVIKWLTKLEQHPHRGWSCRFDLYDLQTA